jgi:glycosyltransferase involved in cell wall biosynthesis
MNILIVRDVGGWAIGNLTDSIKKHLGNRFNIKIVDVHPREVLKGSLDVQTAFHKLENIDLINYHYWNSAVQLIKLVPKLKLIPSILSHWNHESLEKKEWKDFDYLTHPTKYGLELLKKKHQNVKYIPMGIDLDRYSYIQDYPPKEIRIGYIGRIAPWKRLHLICKVSQELGYKVIGSGYIDKPDYWYNYVEHYIKDGVLEWVGGMGRQNMTPSIQKDNIYKKMTVFVMASEGEYESGPLPAQEAMARGIPVLTTKKGTMKDRIEDGINGVFFDDKNFKEKLKELVENEKWRMEIRKKAWETAKGFPEEKMALEFGKLYYQVLDEKK